MVQKNEFTLSIPSSLLKSQNINNDIVALTVDLGSGWGRACTFFLDAALRIAGKQELRGQLEDILMAETPDFHIVGKHNDEGANAELFRAAPEALAERNRLEEALKSIIDWTDNENNTPVERLLMLIRNCARTAVDSPSTQKKTSYSVPRG